MSFRKIWPLIIPANPASISIISAFSSYFFFSLDTFQFFLFEFFFHSKFFTMSSVSQHRESESAKRGERPPTMSVLWMKNTYSPTMVHCLACIVWEFEIRKLSKKFRTQSKKKHSCWFLYRILAETTKKKADDTTKLIRSKHCNEIR